jgi:ActR/RegA family two-component response regulator
MPKALEGHLPTAQGKEQAPSRAPLKVQRLGWERLHQVFLTNYGLFAE